MTHRCLTLVLILLALAAPPLAGQVTERPVAFDSLGRLPSITPRIAERLKLGPPVWPVLGSFVNAQLYTKSIGGYALVVARADGSFDRYDLTVEAAESLRATVESMLASGARAGVGEQTTVASDPAGNAFVRNQALLGVFLRPVGDDVRRKRIARRLDGARRGADRGRRILRGSARPPQHDAAGDHRAEPSLVPRLCPRRRAWRGAHLHVGRG